VGTDVGYSNTNYLLLAMILDEVHDQGHADLIRTQVIEALDLQNTFYYWHDEVPAETAQGYFDLYNNGTLLNMTNYNTGSGNGYGGIYANVFDLQTFIEALARNNSVLNPKSLQEMFTWTEPLESKFREHGLGVFRDYLERPADEYAIGHRGRDLGYTADMFWFPEKDYTLVYLINYGTDAKSELQETFFQFRTAIVDAMME
jgi:D-alanyl-D-alanine carboxypeptidase